MGHLSSKFYFELYEEASYALMQTVFGWNRSAAARRSKGWANLRQEVSYSKELRLDDRLEIYGEITFAKKSLVKSEFEMREALTQSVSSSMKMISCYFDLRERKQISLSPEMFRRLKDYQNLSSGNALS
jgi:acyl-CoA thioesterase FadM